MYILSYIYRYIFLYYAYTVFALFWCKTPCTSWDILPYQLVDRRIYQTSWTSWNQSSLGTIHKTNSKFAFLKKWCGLETILSFSCPAWWEMVSFREVILFGWHPGRLVPSNFLTTENCRISKKPHVFCGRFGVDWAIVYTECGNAETTTVPPKSWVAWNLETCSMDFTESFC